LSPEICLSKCPDAIPEYIGEETNSFGTDPSMKDDAS